MIPKYRAWDKIHKTMYKVYDVDIERKEILVKTQSFKRLSYNFMSGIELMASTGYRDKDGKEIFSEDIVMSRCGLFKGIVIFKQHLGAYVIKSIGYKNIMRLRVAANTVKIVGNFYENPELLEVK